MIDSHCYAYILASKPRGALYIGTAAELSICVQEHRHNLVDGLTSLYAIHQLVYYEHFDKAGPALLRESELKRLPRILKIRLIERFNPTWCDLYDDIALAEMTPA